MRRRLFTLTALFALALLQAAFAQGSATLSGIIKSEEPLPEGTRVAIHVVDRDGVWGQEVASVVPTAGTFSITAEPGAIEGLAPFRSGAVLLPGLQNEYRVRPEGVQYAQGRVNMYIDNNDSGVFERGADNVFIGIQSLEDPIGFYTFLYVDQDATLTATSSTLELKAGWNIFTVRFPGNERPEYAMVQNVNDAVLDVFLPPGMP